MGTLFGPLAAKIAMGLSAVLLVVIGVLWLSLGATRGKLEACRTQHAQFVADVKAQRELARISDLANKHRVEAEQEKERANHEAETQRLRADYAKRVRDYAKAHPGGGNGANLPGIASTPVDPSPASATAIVPESDLLICANNTAAAENWRDWYLSVRAIPR